MPSNRHFYSEYLFVYNEFTVEIKSLWLKIQLAIFLKILRIESETCTAVI